MTFETTKAATDPVVFRDEDDPVEYLVQCLEEREAAGLSTTITIEAPSVQMCKSKQWLRRMGFSFERRSRGQDYWTE